MLSLKSFLGGVMELGAVDAVVWQSLAAVFFVWVLGELCGLSSRALGAALVMAVLVGTPVGVFAAGALVLAIKAVLILKSVYT